MNSFLLNLQLGQVSPQAFSAAQNQRLLSTLQIAPSVTFAWSQDGSTTASTIDHDNAVSRSQQASKAHAAGANAITVDRFEGRYLLSAGADSSIAIWDLEAAPSYSTGERVHSPLGQVKR